MGWYSRVTGIFEYDWYKNRNRTDINDSAPYLTIGYANNQNLLNYIP